METRWSDALPLEGVPPGCIARARLVETIDGWQLPKDRSGRTRLREIVVSALDASGPSGVSDDEALRRFVLGASRRRWSTIKRRLAPAALDVAARLCRAGDVELIFRLSHPTKLGEPTGWKLGGRHVESVAAASHLPRLATGLALDQLGEHAREPWVTEWLESIRRSGLLQKATREGTDLLVRSARIINALPVLTGAPPIGDRELAARFGGQHGAHALDPGHRLTALVLRAAAVLTGNDYPRSAADRRALWAEVGVVADRISSTVIVANLRTTAPHIIARHAVERAEAGLTMHVSAADLDVGELAPAQGAHIYVCENPAVVEGALAAGVQETMVCTVGNPTTTAVRFLQGLADAGCRLHYRGDFDWPGIAIANRLIAAVGATPWAFDNKTYRQAIESHDPDDLVPLSGRAVVPTWDPVLAEAMSTAGRAVHEEHLLGELIEELLRRSA